MDQKTKNHGTSIRAKLLNVAKEEGVFYQTVLTRYFQERLLYRLSQTRYLVNFYLKGGALMFAYDRFAARPTFDVDFLGCNISNESSSVISAFKEICSFPCDEDGVTFDVEQITSQIITEFKDYHGIRLTIPVKMDTISQVMTMDIGFGDVVTPSSISIDYPVMLSNLPGVNIQAYSIETVIAEKLHAVVDLADQSSRMKDYYDLYQILRNEKYEADTLQNAIIRTFENRHTPYDADTKFFRENFAELEIMQVRWKAFLRKITKTEGVSFAEVVQYLQEKLRPYWDYFGRQS